MKAMQVNKADHGPVLIPAELPKPQAGLGELLVRVHAAGVNPVDWKIRQGLLGQSPLPQIMCSDFSGVVEEVGPDVRDFRVGEAVFGVVADESGSYAEFATAPESSVAKKPDALNHVQAAALPIGTFVTMAAPATCANVRNTADARASAINVTPPRRENAT